MTTINSVNIKNANVFFLSYAGIGFIPFAPGTFGSLATIPILYLLNYLPYTLYSSIIILISLTFIAIFITENTQQKMNLHDPGWIVIDEVIGMITTWLFYVTSSLKLIVIMFLLFRFFDIIKIWPASYFDKKVTHGAGTILDDVVSGCFAGISFIILNFFFKFA